MSAQPQKFLFNENFDLNPKDTEKQNPFYIKGYGLGFEQGKQQGEALVRETIDYKLSESTKAIMTSLGLLHEQRQAFFEKLEDETVELARMMASKMLSAQRQEDSLEAILNLVRKSLQAVRETSSFVLKLPMGFKEPLRAYSERAPQENFRVDKIDIVEDETLGPFDCEFHWKDGFSALRGSTLRQEFDSIFALTKDVGEEIPGQAEGSACGTVLGETDPGVETGE